LSVNESGVEPSIGTSSAAVKAAPAQAAEHKQQHTRLTLRLQDELITSQSMRTLIHRVENR
jgi:hypothetical protein